MKIGFDLGTNGIIVEDDKENDTILLKQNKDVIVIHKSIINDIVYALDKFHGFR